MEKISRPAFTYAARNYCLLTKPGIIFGNSITTFGGFTLASKGSLNLFLLIISLLGLSLIIASGCVFNNTIDRDYDRKMKRTQNRGLATGIITPLAAVIFAFLLGGLGTLLLAHFTNWLTVLMALFGFFVYVCVYSFSKYRTMHGTLIGSIAGAIPPVVGYCAASGQFDFKALILFAMITFWQMPHFFAIGIYRLEEYRAASIPILPLKKGIPTAKIHMMIYILAFIGTAMLLPVFHYTSMAYLMISLFLGMAWLALAISGFRCKDDKLWARKMFLFSLIIVMAISLVIPFSVVF